MIIINAKIDNSLQDFIDTKNRMLNEGFTIDETIETFEHMIRQYNAKIVETKSVIQEDVYKKERMLCFCILMSMKAKKNPPEEIIKLEAKKAQLSFAA